MEGEDAAEDDAEYGQEVRHGMATRKRARTTTTNGVTEVKKQNGINCQKNAAIAETTTNGALKSNNLVANGLALVAGEETNSTTYPGASVKVKPNGTMLIKKNGAVSNGEVDLAEDNYQK